MEEMIALNTSFIEYTQMMYQREKKKKRKRKKEISFILLFGVLKDTSLIAA